MGCRDWGQSLLGSEPGPSPSDRSCLLIAQTQLGTTG
uniref:Uncharacterized protein n=1 Tax=Setaria digitata TaxID=48799 RepID=A0A915PGK9_9BILA